MLVFSKRGEARLSRYLVIIDPTSACETSETKVIDGIDHRKEHYHEGNEPKELFHLDPSKIPILIVKNKSMFSKSRLLMSPAHFVLFFSYFNSPSCSIASHEFLIVSFVVSHVLSWRKSKTANASGRLQAVSCSRQKHSKRKRTGQSYFASEYTVLSSRLCK